MTIRSNLLAVLFVFATMIIVGAIVGVFTLGRANDSARRLHQIAQQEILVNDGYKDTTRTRAALTRSGAPPHVAIFAQDLGLRLTREGAHACAFAMP